MMRRRSSLALAGLLAAAALRLGAQGSSSGGPASAAVDARSGQAADLHFRWAAGGRIVGRPLVGDGVVYFLSEDDAIYGLDDSPRALFRSGGFGPLARYRPARGGAMFVADGDSIIRLNRAGLVSWRMTLKGSGGKRGLLEPVEGGDGRVFSAGARIVCRSATGGVLWDKQLPAQASASPRIAPDGSIVLGLEDGSVEDWTPFGARLWSLEGKGAIKDFSMRGQSILVLRESGEALIIASSIPSGTMSPEERGISPAPASLFGPGMRASPPAPTSIPASSAAPSSVPAWGQTLMRDCIAVAASSEDEPNAAWYLLSRSGRLEARDADGGLLWSLECGKGLTRLEAYPGRVYLSGKGRVLSVTRQGILLRELRVSNSSGEAAVSPSGIVYSGGLDWILYAYRFDAERQASYGSPSASPPGDYGLLSEGLSLDQWGGPSRESLSSFLDDVEKSLKSGNMENEADAMRLCAAVALSRFQAPLGPGGERTAAPADLRARACGLLGSTGSLETRPLLIRVLNGDPDPSVKAAAIEGLGRIAWDADSLSAAAIGRAVGSWGDPAKEAMAYSAAVALESISLYEGVPPSPEGMRALIRIVESPWSGKVRSRAEDALKAIVRNSRAPGSAP